MPEQAPNLTFPLKLPPSLHSYVEAFEKDPEKAMGRLENQIKRRGQDPLGTMLLAWFNLKYGNSEQALVLAHKVRCQVSGSPLLSVLPYALFDPAFPDVKTGNLYQNSEVPEQSFLSLGSYAVGNLDTLIDQLSTQQSIQVEPGHSLDEHSDLSARSAEVEEIVTETLARITEAQGNLEEAAKMYRRLAVLYPEKAKSYKKQAKSLEKNISKD